MTTKYSRCYVLLTALVLIAVLFAVLQYQTDILTSLNYLQKDHETEDDYEFLLNDNETENIKNFSIDYSGLRNNLIKVTKSLLVAKTHVRGIKTETALHKALSDIKTSLNILNIKGYLVGKSTIQDSVSICPEEYKGSKFGYPLFEKGFEMINCSNSKPLKNIITILLYYENACNENYITNVLNGIHKYTEQIRILLAVPNTYKDNYLNMQRSYPQLFVTVYKPDVKKGKVLNDLIKGVRTEYVLIGLDITHFNKDVRLERMIREIERLKVTVAAGASRNQHGHWNLGCFQTAYKNHSLIYHEGYDESRHECVFCDFIMGPFIIRTNVIKEVLFDSDLTGNGLFEDYFLRLTEAGHENVICPDSMFYVNRTITEKSERSWTKFGLKWSLSRLKISPELDIYFSCDKPYKCSPGKGYAVNPCCLQELADLVKVIMDICEKHKIICELCEGTLLGAVKFNKVLPWELDADLGFPNANYSSLSKLKTKFADAGYRMSINKGYFLMFSKHWSVDVYPKSKMTSEDLISENMKTTKILYDGKWVNGPRNPGLHARNRYGHEIYEHAQHWSRVGKKSGFEQYNPNIFTKCAKPGKHNCLDRYNPDGNLQFREPLP